MPVAADTRTLLTRFSDGQITAIEARKHLGDATYGDLLRLLAAEGLTLPATHEAGREMQLAKARAWMFPDHAA